MRPFASRGLVARASAACYLFWKLSPCSQHFDTAFRLDVCWFVLRFMRVRPRFGFGLLEVEHGRSQQARRCELSSPTLWERHATRATPFLVRHISSIGISLRGALCQASTPMRSPKAPLEATGHASQLRAARHQRASKTCQHRLHLKTKTFLRMPRVAAQAPCLEATPPRHHMTGSFGKPRSPRPVEADSVGWGIRADAQGGSP